MSTYLTKYKAGSTLIYMLGILLVACAPLATNIDRCELTGPTNVYDPDIPIAIESIYSIAPTPGGADNPMIPSGSTLQAFEMLVSQVRRWSSAVDVPDDNQRVIRITITYLSPELLYTILLNTQLEYQPGVPLDQFKKIVKERMEVIAKRSELIFLVTITYSNPEKGLPGDKMLILNFPAKEIVLLNSANKGINVSHFDPPLGQEIIISRSHLSGYIAYPMGLKEGENCVNCIDASWNNVITLSTDGLTTSHSAYNHQLNWLIRYHPLIETQANVGSSISYVFSLSAGEIAPAHAPPPPVWNVPAEEAGDEYWVEMARYIWGYVTDP
jgi:hypothetical protein